MTYFFGLLQLVYLHCLAWFIWPPLPMQRSLPTFVYKLPTPLMLMSYIISLHPPHSIVFLAALLYLLLSLSLLTRSWFFNGMLGGLQARNAAWRSDRTHSRSGILSSVEVHASGGVIIFVRQGLSFSELSIFLLGPYSDYTGVKISLNKLLFALFS